MYYCVQKHKHLFLNISNKFSTLCHIQVRFVVFRNLRVGCDCVSRTVAIQTLILVYCIRYSDMATDKKYVRFLNSGKKIAYFIIGLKLCMDSYEYLCDGICISFLMNKMDPNRPTIIRSNGFRCFNKMKGDVLKLDVIF